jgi:[ribosomal protein S18]-alanine N-acetyltransferase
MITIRNAREEDRQILAEIGYRSWDAAMSRIGETAAMAANAMVAFDSFVAHSWLTITVVESDGATAGWAAREQLDENISDLWIDPTYMRQGLGKALLAAVEAEMAEQGLDKAVVQTHARNNEAVSFFESQGYQIHWLSVAYSPKLDRDVETVGLSKPLAAATVGTYGPGI